ncbi:MAG: contact-dependent growth inhibition system immunity protein [Hyphomonadaceae bacterium]
MRVLPSFLKLSHPEKEKAKAKFAAAWVEVHADMAFVFAQSGGRGVVADHDAFSTTVKFPPAGVELGAAVRAALNASRYLNPKRLSRKALEGFMFGEAQARHAQWLQAAMHLTGAKSERSFNKGIHACALLRREDELELTPTLDGKGSWGKHQATDEDIRFIPVNASDHELQAAVLEALSRSR